MIFIFGTFLAIILIDVIFFRMIKIIVTMKFISQSEHIGIIVDPNITALNLLFSTTEFMKILSDINNHLVKKRLNNENIHFEQHTCPICFEHFSRNKFLITFSCGHCIDYQCAKALFISKIMNEKNIECPFCRHVEISYPAIEQFFTENESKLKKEKYLNTNKRLGLI